MKRLLILCMGLIILGSGCGGSKVPPMNVENNTLAEDEQRLWKSVEKEQAVLDASGFLLDDPELEAYAQGVLDKIIPPGTNGHITYRVKIIKDPTLNAMTYPNGVIYVHTGMLARFENEAQLASVLSHEAIHAKNRHGIAKRRDLKKRSAIYASMGLGSAGPSSAGLISAMGTMGLASAVAGFSRELEQEADEQGFALMVQAGYAPQESVKAFQHLKEWSEENELDEPFFFGSHPALEERISNFKRLCQESGKENGAGITGADGYREHTGKLILIDASQNLDEGRFDVAERETRQYLEIDPDSEDAHYLLGKICLERNKEQDLEKALEHFQQAVRINPDHAPSHRGMGTVYLKQGKCELATEHFTQYMALAPQAPDKAYVIQYIKECKE